MFLLSECLFCFIQERLLNESKTATAFPVKNLDTDTSDKADFAIGKSFPPTKSSYDSKPAIPSPSQKLSSPPFTKKGISEAVAKAGKAEIKEQSPNLENTRDATTNKVQLKNVDEVKNAEVKKTGEENKLQKRPSNPFAKSSNKQEKSSLFDSLKKKNVQ